MLRRLLADNVLLGLQYATSALVALLLVPHFLHTLGAMEYGRLAIAVAALGYGAVIVQYAFQLTGPAAVAAATSEQRRREILADVLLARGLLCAAVLGIVGAALLVSGEASVPAWWVLLGLPLGAALHCGWYLQTRGQVGALAMISIAATLASLAIGFTQVEGGGRSGNVWAAVALTLGPLGAGAGTCAWALLGNARARPSLARARQALRDGRAPFASQFVAALYSLAGPIVVGALAGAGAAGLYSAVERVFSALLGGLTLTHTAAYPRLADAYWADRLRYGSLLRWVVGAQLAGAVALGLILLVAFEPLAALLLGPFSHEAAALLGPAWLWLTLATIGPVLTGYLMVSNQSNAILRLTGQVLLVSFPLGCAATLVVGASGWIAGLAVGQAWVVWRAAAAWRTTSAAVAAS